MEEIIKIILNAYDEEIDNIEYNLNGISFRTNIHIHKIFMDDKKENFKYNDILEGIEEMKKLILNIEELYNFKNFVNKKNTIEDIERSYKKVNHNISSDKIEIIEEFIEIQQQLKNF